MKRWIHTAEARISLNRLPSFLASMTLGLGLVPGWLAAADATLDFGSLEHRVMSGTGGSICQFDIAPHWGGAKSITWKSQGVLSNDYSNLGGFPDDGNTAYGRFLDFVFGTEGQWQGGYHNVWFTQCPWMAPLGADSLTANYADLDWSKFEFKWFEPTYRFTESATWNLANDSVDPEAYGHTFDILRNGMKRLHEQNQRMIFWIDLHYSWPMEVWRDANTSTIIPESKWDQAAMYHVVFARYLISRYGIPIEAISFMNEPNVSGDERSKWTNEQLARFPITLRAKLDEADLYGVRCIPSTPNRINSEGVRVVDELLANPAWAEFSDYVSGHNFGEAGINETMFMLPETPVWLGSGHNLTGDVDRDIKLSLWRLKNDVELLSGWQLSKLVTDEYTEKLGSKFTNSSDPAASQSNDGLLYAPPTVWPFVRPGMWMVGGAVGDFLSSDPQIAGFAGRGHRDTIVVASDTARSVTIDLTGTPSETFTVFQCTNTSPRSQLADLTVSGGQLTFSVPANSVTTLIGDAASAPGRAYVIVGDASNLTATDQALLDAAGANGLQAIALSQSLGSAERTTHYTKRHPVDPMGAACYLISDSVTEDAAVQAHDHVQAPVLILGGKRTLLGLGSGVTVHGGNALSMRRPADPPSSMLINGVPRACGYRAHLLTADSTTLNPAVRSALLSGGVIEVSPDPNPPVITDGPTVIPSLVTDTMAAVRVTANDPDEGETLTYFWSAVGPAPVSASGNSPNETLTFTNSGEYTVEVSVVSSGGGVALGSVQVEVIQTPSELRLTLPE